MHSVIGRLEWSRLLRFASVEVERMSPAPSRVRTRIRKYPVSVETVKYEALGELFQGLAKRLRRM